MHETLRKLNARRNDAKGFTLIELLLVIVIMGILAAVVVFSVKGIQNKGQDSACKTDVTTVATAEEAYYAQNGSWTDTAGLKAAGLLRSVPTNVTADAATGAVTGTGVCAAFSA